MGEEKEMVEMLIYLGVCKEWLTAEKTVKTIKFLGLDEKIEIPVTCRSAFDVTCLCMQEKLTYSDAEMDMVLLHHEVEVDFPDDRPAETHQATLLEFGKAVNNKTTTAMALTAAIGALLLMENKIQTRGVLRPLEPEIYVLSAHFKKWCMMQSKIRSGAINECKKEVEQMFDTARKYLMKSRTCDDGLAAVAEDPTITGNS